MTSLTHTRRRIDCNEFNEWILINSAFKNNISFIKMLSIWLSTVISYHALCFVNLIEGLYFGFFCKLRLVESVQLIEQIYNMIMKQGSLVYAFGLRLKFFFEDICSETWGGGRSLPYQSGRSHVDEISEGFATRPPGVRDARIGFWFWRQFWRFWRQYQRFWRQF